MVLFVVVAVVDDVDPIEDSNKLSRSNRALSQRAREQKSTLSDLRINNKKK
jgi:hypothetical protein